MGKAVFRLLSRNATHGQHKATDVEMLQEKLDKMKDALEEDLLEITSREFDEDHEYLYPKCVEKILEQAGKFKQNNQGYRQLCLMPSFVLGLVMVSRVRRHYTHARWYNIGTLDKMIDVYGGVSDSLFGVGDRSDISTYSSSPSSSWRAWRLWNASRIVPNPRWGWPRSRGSERSSSGETPTRPP